MSMKPADPLQLNHVWLFVTDRCNFRCGYCFFRHKTGRRVMSQKVFHGALAYGAQQGEFIFSGGEPLCVWNDLKKMLKELMRSYPGRYAAVQTNASLMDRSRAGLLSRWAVSVEVGIDGDEMTTLTNRPGAGIVYGDILKGVGTLLRGRGGLTTTMTVHPSGVGCLEKNVRLLAGMGLRSIEVHPAFLEDWGRNEAGIFLEQYSRATAWTLKEGCPQAIGRGYSQPAGGVWDMVVLPDGKVLPSWVFLSFPLQVRSRFYIMDLASGKVRLLPGARAYFSRLERFLEGCASAPSYRALSDFNALVAVASPGGRSFTGRVRRYVELCERIEQIDHNVLQRAGRSLRKHRRQE